MNTIKFILGMFYAIIQDRLIRLTHRMWYTQISRIIFRAYNDGVIDSRQLEALLSAFDPSQKHMVYGKYSEWSFDMLKKEGKK